MTEYETFHTEPIQEPTEEIPVHSAEQTESAVSYDPAEETAEIPSPPLISPEPPAPPAPQSVSYPYYGYGSQPGQPVPPAQPYPPYYPTYQGYQPPVAPQVPYYQPYPPQMDPRAQKAYETHMEYEALQKYPIPRGSKGAGRVFTVLFWVLGSVLLTALIVFIIMSNKNNLYNDVDPGMEFPQFNIPADPDIDDPHGNEGNMPEESQPPKDEIPNDPAIEDQPIGEKPSNAPVPSYEGIRIKGARTKAISAKEIYRNVVNSVVGVNVKVGSGLSEGSGIILTEDGLILTNAHVLDYSLDYPVTVALYDGTEYVASVIGFDKYSDLAVLRIDADHLPAATFGDTSRLEVGDEVFAIGNPGGMSYASSLTGGYISALNRALESSTLNYIQTDAAINPGNSGGALVNDCGQIVGINSNKIVSTGYEGMGFAIPISDVSYVINDLVRLGYVEGRGRLGVTLSLKNSHVCIEKIDAESDLTGQAEPGDYLLAVEGTEISVIEDLYPILAVHSAGDTIALTIGDISEQRTRDVELILLPDRGETQQTVILDPEE